MNEITNNVAIADKRSIEYLQKYYKKVKQSKEKPNVASVLNNLSL